MPRALALIVLFALASCTAEVTSPESEWQVLFDGTSLEHWTITSFGGEGEVATEDGRMLLDFGSPMTGVTWSGSPLPVADYELTLDAAREDGTDFFCGLTFPVGDSHASLILGGWGGALCGLSSIDGMDASENETTSFQTFEKGRRYRVRVAVDGDHIRAWLDDKPLFDVAIDGRSLSVRPEVQPSRPLGITSFSTRASIGPLRLRPLPH